MQKHVLLVIIVIVLVTVVSGCSPEKEEQKPQVKVEKVKVAVVDESQLWIQSEKAKDYQQQLNSKVDQLKAEYDHNLEDLSAEEQTAKYQKVYQQINDLREQLKEEFGQEIAQAVKTIAEENDYDVVLNQDEVRYGGRDITDQVLKKIDGKTVNKSSEESKDS